MRVIHDVGDSNDKPTIAVLLAGEHLLVREGLRKLLEGEPGIVVVGDVADPQEALTVTRAVKPKIVIVAFSGRPLIRTLRSLRQLAPAGDYGRAIVLAARITGKQMTQALQLGVAGILLKETSARTLVERLRTVAADDPQLTTRLVEGPNPLRVVLDPARRLGVHHRVFTDGSAETIYVCSRPLVHAGEDRFGCASIVGLEGTAERIDPAALMRLLRGRGCTRVFVEGGGVTVSMFLEANQLDRLHMTIAPLLIGNGRPAIRLPAPAALGDCHRPRYRVFRMGGDVLFDCELGVRADDEGPDAGDRPPVTRVV